MSLSLLLASIPLACADPADEDARARATWVDAARVVVDGDHAEWTAGRAPDVSVERLEQLIDLGRPASDLWSGAKDLSARIWLGWSRDDLIVGGEVLDEYADYNPERWYQGDSLELFLNFADRASHWGADDYQLMLAPAWEERPWGVYSHSDRPPGPSDGGFGGVEVASAPIEGGYRFEARIPWRNFAFAPRGGESLGFNFAISDRDGRGAQESYGSWTGDSEIAFHADRRGELLLESPPASALPADAQRSSLPSLSTRSIALIVLASLYAVALWTRGLWRRPRARKLATVAGLTVLAASAAVAFLARFARSVERDARRAEVESYADEFAALVGSGALGEREPDELRRVAQALLAGKSIAPYELHAYAHAAPDGVALGKQRRTERRGIPFRPMLAPGAPEASLAGITLEPGGSAVLALPEPARIDAVHVVMRVSDPRYLRAGAAQTPVLAVELLRGGEAVAPAREVRNRQDLHLEEDPHRDHRGLEPAFYEPGGRAGRAHGDGLLLELSLPRDVDQIVVRHVGSERGYAVALVALAARVPRTDLARPAGLRANAGGEWEWSAWRGDVEAQVESPDRAPRRAESVQTDRALAVGAEPIGRIFFRDVKPLPRTHRWDLAPVVTAAAIAPFLVALAAEWLSARRRIRNKLALGFAIASAVPLLALTLLLDATLRQEHEQHETERVEAALARAEQDLEREQRELEREAERLLRIATLRWQIGRAAPQSSRELAGPAWWGEGDPGAIRVLMRVTAEGRWERVGAGPGWSTLPKGFMPTSGLWRPWGKLLVCGVAQSASGAEQPLFVLVAREARAADLEPTRARRASDDDEQSVRLLGAGADPAPTLDDLRAGSSGELRRALYTPSNELAGVLIATRRARGVPVLADFTLTELLFAAGLIAVFTALLFARILTGHLVGPIESLDRALRAGSPAGVRVDSRDEVAHLAGAIQSFSSEVENRVRQLQSLTEAQEDLASRLDAPVVRETVLRFVVRETRGCKAWLLWRGEIGESPRLIGVGEREYDLPDDARWLARVADAGQVAELRDQRGMPCLSASERELFADCERVIGLPLVAGGACRGAILIGVEPGSAELDLDFLKAACAQAAIALENARLYGQAIHDPSTGFLSEPAFRQRVIEEIERAESHAGAGVLIVELRLTDLTDDEAQAAARLREASRRVRAATRGLAVFGRAGAADLLIALPWLDRRPSFDAVVSHVCERLTATSWPDGTAVRAPLASQAAWPDDGPSARFVLQVLDERLSEVQSAQPEETLEFLRTQLPTDFIAGAPAMVELLDTARRLAQQDVTVLISGETGAGKDRLAELLHRWSPRAAGPLIHVHCPSLSTSLIEDELFGHEVGAFTGASARRVGPFEFAAGGTVVLDEIAGLPPAGQVALLRLVETRQVLPLGSTRPVLIDVRLVVTTSTDLAAEVERGTFRSDLYYRLNVAQLALPPLRVRKQALPELVDAAVRRFNAASGRPVTGVAPGVLDRLFEHDWPGNLRELFNVLSRGLILAQGGDLRPEHLNLETEPSDRMEPAHVALNDRQRAALEQLPTDGSITSNEHAAKHGVSNRTGLRDLLDLVELGYLERQGERRGTRFRRTRKVVSTG